MRKTMLRLMPLALLLLLVGCGGTTVERMETDEVKDLSGRWNDSDSQMVSEAMIQDCLNRPWLSDYTARSGKKPDIIVGSIRNRSSEHIATEVFVKDLERALLNSGRANFVASSAVFAWNAGMITERGTISGSAVEARPSESSRSRRSSSVSRPSTVRRSPSIFRYASSWDVMRPSTRPWRRFSSAWRFWA